ncbi:VIT domain-containing protein [uncultured Kordia sp.]|uniref:VIT domain-containing protein n=1 Tax=uncultured Kordia sp. TaxID=507699 RepID=UPI002606018C|nr:VIT domain-containing protein [uncultured Kordia sp.]
MKTKLHFLFYFISLTVLAQQLPKVTLSGDKELKLTDLKVHVDIVGNLAVTTYDMKFYNELDRTLEGQLVFPLGEGQVVSGFAMDVNGKLRDAVIVEKELARVAFETTIRRKIDPGLLEKTEGNNYKARVYPIFAKKHKHIVIKFEQELSTLNGMQTYELPLGITETLDNFSVAISVFNAQQPIVSKTPYKDFFFKKSNASYVAKITQTTHAPTKPIVVQIPNKENQESLSTYNGYFQYYKALTPASRLKSKPKKVTILWDASYSLRNRNLDNELKVLTDYIDYLQNLKVTLITFNNTIQKTEEIRIRKGGVSTLIDRIKSVQYDGGTKLDVFKNIKIKADEVLLFSDGLGNLGEFLLHKKVPVYTINSLVSSNHQHLIDVATQSGGSYINLTRVAASEATKMLKEEIYQFLGANHDETVREIYPKQRTNVYQDFVITGKFKESTTVELLFGYGGKVTEKVSVKILRGRGTKVVKRLWAKQKLIDLNRNKKRNKQQIISLGKQYDLITDYTSMLILDRLQDYVRYRIEPPKELMEQYKQRLANDKNRETAKKERIAYQKRALTKKYNDLLRWYDKEYVVKETVKEVKKQTEERTQVVVQENTNTETTRAENNTQQNNANSLRTISGTVTDESGLPLPGASINIRGTSVGVTTDFDGKYSIGMRTGEVIVFSYVGYLTIAHTVDATENTLHMELKPGSTLEEVVVVAYGTEKRSRSVTSAVSVVKSESIEQVPTASREQILQGQAAGLRISNGSEDSGQPRHSDNVVLRGRASISGNAEPLYVINGVPSDASTFKKLQQEDIKEMSVIKNSSATALYGNRGANGVMVITTKNGFEENKAAIEALEEKIANTIEMKPWNANQPYIIELEKETTIEDAYNKYLKIRESYANMPTFYLDVADFFNERKASAIATTVITNLMEVELNNYELLKAMAYKLEYFKRYDMAVIAYEKVLELRPEEPQSYRDLALAYEQVGAYQKSYDLLFQLYDGQLLGKDEGSRFTGIEKIVFIELTRLITMYGNKLNIPAEVKNKFTKMPVDVRITIDWNHNNTDIDLWVFDPNGEKAFYGHKETVIGGRMSDDLTQGYGPEEFLLKKASKGEYKVYVNHYSNNVQKISGPTILKVTLYKNYGTKDEQKEVSIVRLADASGELEIGSLFFTKEIQ